MLDSIIEYYYILPLVAFFTLALTLSVNHWDMNEIEKKCVTRFKRLQIELSIIIVETVTLGILLALALNKKLLEPFESENYDIYAEIFIVIVCLFLISLPIILAINGAISFTKFLISPRVKYFFELDTSNEKWTLEKTSIKGQILLKSENGNYMLLGEADKMIFTPGDMEHTYLGKMIFKSSKNFNLTMLFLAISILVIVLCFIFLHSKIQTNFLYSIIFLSSMILLLSIFFTVLAQKSVNESNNS